MSITTRRLMKLGVMTAAAGAIAIGLFATVPAMGQAARAAATASMAPTRPITRGQQIVMATHSFNVFISTDPNRAAPTRTQAVTPGGAAAPAAAATTAAAPAATGVPLLTQLTNERGITGQKFLAVQMIGGSTPMQHWNEGNGDDSKNRAKAALSANGDKVDVFTMSPNAIMPEPGIDNFGNYIIAHNKNARIMVQNSWGSYDGHGTTPAVGGTGGGSFTNADRDKATIGDVAGWIASLAAPGGYLERLRTQLDGINKRAGHQIAYVVPSGQAVYTLRALVLQGKVPGLTKQSDMHLDPIGHPKPPVAHLVAYVWFAAMYRQSPVGLKVLVDKNDPTSAAREKMLQQIAWDAVLNEPMSGVRGTPVTVGA